MPGELFDSDGAAASSKSGERKVYGVSVALVVNNVDALGEGRIQIQLPWLGGVFAMARVATLMGGMLRGTYFLPQRGDEVLVVFHHGDIGEPYIIGALWNTVDRPPALLPTDPTTKRKIRSPLGHEISFDEVAQSISITSTTQQSVTLDPSKVEMSTVGGLASVVLETNGNVTIKAAVNLTLQAQNITLDGTAITINGKASTSIAGGKVCTINATQVNIN